MGQKVGKAVFIEQSRSFLNLPRGAIEALWQAFNDVADGFGISCDEFQEICTELKGDLNCSGIALDERSAELFDTFDTDRNEMVDAVEFLTTICAASGMRMEEIFEFLFMCYDFDGGKELTIDEVTLALKSTLTGLCKLTGEEMPREDDLEMLCMKAFDVMGRGETDKVMINEMVEFCLRNPDIQSWGSYFSDPQEYGLTKHDLLPAEIDYDREGKVLERSAEETAANDCDAFAFPNLMKEPTKTHRWLNATNNLTPSAFANAKFEQHPPSARLVLEWVHGYEGERCKNNVRYSATGDIVYNAARLGISYNFDTHKQQYAVEHTDDILSFAMHPRGTVVATGEAGRHPKIVLWEAATCNTVCTLSGFHAFGVCLLAFSPDGDMLASVGQDEFHSVAVYAWQERRMVFSSRCDRRVPLGCDFGPRGELAVCGSTFMWFWRKEFDGYVRRKGNFGKNAKVQPQACITRFHKGMVSGTVSGHLFVWADRNCVRSIRAHRGCVNALYASSTTLASGGKDMKVRLWTVRMEPGPTFDMSGFGALASVRSLCLSQDGTRLLLGTRGAEIYEVSAVDGSNLRNCPITTGHFGNKLKGLASNPVKAEFATVGDDQTLRIWDITTRSMVKMTRLDTAARSVAYNPSGDLIFVGLGGDEPSPKDGSFIVFNESDLSVIHEARDAKDPVSIVKVSPDGETLAVGCEDKGIYLYAVNDDYEMVGRCGRHEQTPTHIDFSQDSEWMMSNAQAGGGEVLFFSADDATFMSNLGAMRDVEWANHGCIYTYYVQGCHTPYEDNERLMSAQKSPAADFVATGTNFGAIKLFKFPCIEVDSEHRAFYGHSAGVSGLQFDADGEYLLSIGEEDRSIFQWKVVFDDREETAEALEMEESDGYALEMRDGSDINRDAFHKGSDWPIGALQLELLDMDEKSSAVKPWMEKVVPPTEPPVAKVSVPEVSIALERVHGYRSEDVRGNLHYTASGALCYSVAALGVVLSPANNSQHFNTGQAEDIVSLAASPDGRYAATGSIGKRPRICVWDTETGDTLRFLEGFHRRAVTAMAFSRDGKFLATAGQDNHHRIAVYNWENSTIVAYGQGGPQKVLGLAFSPTGHAIVQCGLEHVRVWVRQSQGRLMGCSEVVIGPGGGFKMPLTCAVYFGMQPIVGTADGHFYVLTASSSEATIDAQKAARLMEANSTDQAGEGAHLEEKSGGDEKDDQLDDEDDEDDDEDYDEDGEGGYDDAEGGEEAKGESKAARRRRKKKKEQQNAQKSSSMFMAGSASLDMLKELVEMAPVALERAVKAHEEGVQCMCVAPGDRELVTGGKDGVVKIWNMDFECINEISVSDLGGGVSGAVMEGGNAAAPLNPHVRAVCVSVDGERLGIGTRGAEVYELNYRNGRNLHRGALVRGHGNREVWGCATHPIRSEFVTGGDDGTIRVWDVASHKMLRHVHMDVSCRALDFHPDGGYLAAGLGSGAKVRTTASKDGTLVVFNPDNLSVLFETKDTGEWIRCVRFSPDGRTLAVGGQDSRVFLYSTLDSFNRRATITVNRSFVTGIDFTEDSAYVQTCDGANNLNFSESASAVTIPSAVKLRDATWEGWSCNVGWYVQGLWLNQPPRSKATSVWRSRSGNMIASGNSTGRVNVFNFPANQSAAFLSYQGHSGSVTGVRWTTRDSHLISVGGHDSCIMVWKCTHPDEIDSGDEAGHSCDDSAVEVDGGAGVKEPSLSLEQQLDWAEGTVKPWVQAMVPPSNIEDDDSETPTVQFEVEYAHGFRSGDVRDNLKYNCRGDAVLCCGSLGVIHCKADNTQTFYTEHKFSVISLDVSPDRLRVATGDVGRAPEVHVWDSITAKQLIKFENVHQRAVSLLRFSPSGKLLASLGHDRTHSVCIFRSPTGLWHDAHVLSSISTGTPKTLCLEFCGPANGSSARSTDFPIFVGGVKQVLFLRLEGATLTKERGIFGKKKKIQPILSAARALDGDDEVMASGTASGHLYLWDEKTCRVRRVVSAHLGPVYAMCCVRQGVASAGKDGLVRLWSRRWVCDMEINVATFDPNPFFPIPQSLGCSSSGSRLAVGTRGAEVYEVSLDTQRVVSLLESHSKREMRGLALCPTNPDLYATVGDDAVVRVWSVSRRRCLRRARLDAAARCCAWSPDGHFIALGVGGDPNAMTKDGAFMILDADTLEVLFEDRKSKLWIRQLKYTPAGDLLAIASEDGRIYIHEARNYQLMRECVSNGTGAPITHFDFSNDGEFIRACTTQQELLYFNSSSTEQITSHNVVRDVEWETHNIPYGWTVQGAWPQHEEDIVLNSISVDPANELLVSGDGRGHLRVFNYPTQTLGAKCLNLPGTSTSIYANTFTADGERLLAVDSLTRTIIQYRRVRPEEFEA